VVLAALVLAGCGTISPALNTVSATSEPAGAEVNIDGQNEGATPTELTLPPK